MPALVNLEGCKILQKIFDTEILIYDETSEDVPEILKNKICNAILTALPKIKEIGYFPLIRINLVAAPFRYYEFAPTPADLMKIKTGSNFNVAAYEHESDPPIIFVMADQLYNFFLAARKQAVLNQDIIKTVKGANQAAIKEIIKEYSSEDRVYAAAIEHALAHEIVHVYQDKKTKLLKIQKRLKTHIEIKGNLKLFAAMANGMEEFAPIVANTIVEDIEKFRMALQTEGTAEFAAKALLGQPDLKDTYYQAVPFIEDIKNKIDSFFFDFGLASKIDEKEKEHLIEEWKKVEEKMEHAAYPIGLHMVTLLSWKYSIDKIIKLSRYRFMNEYLWMAREISEYGTGFNPVVLGPPLVAIGKGAPALLNLDDIKTKVIELYEHQRKIQ